jgi:hypothetical protein
VETGDERALDDLPEELRALETADEETRLKLASELVTRYQHWMSEASRIRRETLAALVEDGRSQGDLAKILGTSRARIGQLLISGPRPERALLGAGPLTVAIGGKHEGPKPSGSGSTMISREAASAFQLLAEAADSCGLSATQEIVPPPGHTLRLNRPNLIVLGSPRILPLVTQVLDSDPNLGFSSGARGWYLTEGEKIHRSPSDSGIPADYGYLGRLPRTDSKGTFLFIAGIHAMGTLGAVTYLVNNLDSLYQEVKRGRWSTLVETRYDPDDPHKIQSVERITPIYTV